MRSHTRHLSCTSLRFTHLFHWRLSSMMAVRLPLGYSLIRYVRRWWLIVSASVMLMESRKHWKRSWIWDRYAVLFWRRSILINRFAERCAHGWARCKENGQSCWSWCDGYRWDAHYRSFEELRFILLGYTLFLVSFYSSNPTKNLFVFLIHAFFNTVLIISREIRVTVIFIHFGASSHQFTPSSEPPSSLSFADAGVVLHPQWIHSCTSKRHLASLPQRWF